MKNLKELILRTADRHALDVSLQAAEIIAEALLAEIAKENAPFGWWHEGETDEESDFHLVESGAGEDCPTCLPLYTFPPSTDKIENRVAEACAKWYDEKGWMIDLDDIANAIRSGAWKEHLK